MSADGCWEVSTPDRYSRQVSATEPSEPFTLVYLLPSRVERLTLRGFPQVPIAPAPSNPCKLSPWLPSHACVLQGLLDYKVHRFEDPCVRTLNN